MFSKNISQIAIVMVALLSLAVATPAQAGLIPGTQTVEGTLVGTTDTFPYKYKQTFDGTTIVREVAIDFTFAGTWTEAEKAAYLATTKTSIKDQWNGKVYVKDTASGTTYPCVVNVAFVGPFDQTVTVGKIKGANPYDVGNWYADYDVTYPNARSHEFGHMLGLYDEYPCSWQHPTNPRTSLTSLMGGGRDSEYPGMPPHYYTEDEAYVKSLNPSGSFDVAPEPASMALLAAGMTFVIRRTRRRIAA